MEVPFDRRRSFLYALALCLLWIAGRCLCSWTVIFPAAHEVDFLDGDSFLHLRQVRELVAGVRLWPRWDPLCFYPDGTRSDISGLYDVLLAIAVRLGGGNRHLEPICAWAPVVLGCGSLLWLRQLLLPTLGKVRSWLGPFLMVLFPGTLARYGCLGYADHHSWEVFCSLWFIWGLQQLLWNSDPAHGRQPAWTEALPAVVLLLSWPGSALHLAVAALLFLVASLQGLRPARAALRWTSAVVLMWLIPVAVYPDFSLGWHYDIASALVLVLIALGIPLLDWMVARRLKWVLGVFLCGYVAALVAHPFTRTLLQQLLQPRNSTIAEHETISPELLWRFFGPAGLLALWSLLPVPRGRWGAGKAWTPGPQLAVTVCCLCYAGLWLQTRDFSYFGPAPVAAFAALTVASWGEPRRRNLPLWLLLLAPPLVQGNLGVQPFWTTESWARAQVAAPADWRESLAWLNALRPPATRSMSWMGSYRGGTPIYPPGIEGTYCEWERAHLISYFTGLPTMYSHSESRRQAEWSMEEDERYALVKINHGCRPPQRMRWMLLQAADIGEKALAQAQVAGLTPTDYLEPYAVVSIKGTDYTLASYRGKLQNTLTYRCFARNADGLSHFRLLHTSSQQCVQLYVAPYAGDGLGAANIRTLRLNTSEIANLAFRARRAKVTLGSDSVYYDAHLYPSCKLFEVVAGARLHGRCAPGQPRMLELPLVNSVTQDRIVWHHPLNCDADGNFVVTVPYSTGASNLGDFRAVDGYHLGRRRIGVPEDAVEGGIDLRIAD